MTNIEPQHKPGLPGEWTAEWDEADAAYQIVHSPFYRAGIISEGAVIADVRTYDFRDWRTPEEADAIVRIICAAPDLLAACKELVDALEDVVYGTPDESEPIDWEEAIEHAVAAVAKAEGRE